VVLVASLWCSVFSHLFLCGLVVSCCGSVVWSVSW